MVISEIEIKGYKSFGNNPQVLKLNTEKGELILLLGLNGHGKSSIIESFEFCLYGKVKSNKTKKWTKLSSLPNRINGELLNRIKFKAHSTDVEVIRGISPNKVELFENGILNERAGKVNIDSSIESYVDMDIETFKSFISISINDFKNFISLSNEEKKLLLDKLFNLEVINRMNDILKDLIRTNKNRINALDSEINTFEQSLISIKRSLENINKKRQENVLGEIEDLRRSMDERKSIYLELKIKLDKIKEKDKELVKVIDEEKRQLLQFSTDMRGVEKEISLFDNEQCPTCATSFKTEQFETLRNTLVIKLNKTKEMKIVFEDNLLKIKTRKEKLDSIFRETNETYSEMSYFLRDAKSKLDVLEQKQKENDSLRDEDLEIIKSIDELTDRKESAKVEVTSLKEVELAHKELTKIFSEEGVKKAIIKSIVKPINHFITENIKTMRLPYEVKLDESFTAEIKTLGDTVDPDSLSTGETRRINIAILIAYLKMIRTKKHINILFLDEVFSSIDLQGIQDILSLLRSFANEYNINIFVVHHALMNNEDFDRIIQVNKNVFTTIEELHTNE